ncbi:ubiquitin thioesterase OTU1 [Diorhabda sublineata]|uniref:ubiquitin thioesterase OTU1 n=1 Tax=Diorhabda sublineata TaxID=1163346 RepID=UPI0024E1045B|nr:ubiquitin thioesterase OTU1 [Diorhabda sublineata]
MTGFALRIKTKTGHQIVNNITKDSTVEELKQVLSNLSSIPINRLQILTGFPPKLLDLSRGNEPIGSSGITSGDTLILEEKLIPDNEQQDVPMLENEVENPFDYPGILMKHIVPSDNSCLFTSVHFVLNGKIDESGSVNPYLRQLVAETIKSDRELYNEAILGKPVDTYCIWIQDDKSWGGAIELSILANHYGMEIAVIDTINAIINKFGEDQNYPHRVFLLFDGIHYDPIFLEPFNGGKIQTIFPTDDDRILQLAEQLAHEAKSSRQFTDVNKFTLKCMVCNVLLKGQVAAQEHAQSTGHANFGEV